MMTLLTALTIQNNESVQATHGGPATDNGKYLGWITLGLEYRYRPLLNTEAIYDTPEEADAAMQALIDEIKARDLSSHTSGLIEPEVEMIAAAARA